MRGGVGLDGTSRSGSVGARRQDSTANVLGPRAGLLLSTVLALLLGALSVLVMLPAAQHLRSLHDGLRAQATLRTNGPCMTGGCRVAFEVDGRTVESSLPVGSGGRLGPVGTRLAIRYRADDPQLVAREEDVHGGGAAVLAAVSGGSALLFGALSAYMLVHLGRQRRERRSAP